MWYSFLHFCCTNLEFLTLENFSRFVSHWNKFGAEEELRRYAREAQNGQGDIQVCLCVFSDNAVLMLLQLQFERGSRKFAETKSKATSVRGKPFPAPCQARSPLVCPWCAVRCDCRYLLHNPPSLCISSWGTTSYQTHQYGLPNLLLSGMADKCWAPSGGAITRVTIFTLYAQLREPASGATSHS